MLTTNEALLNKWKPILEHGDLPQIKDNHRRDVIATLLENTESVVREQHAFAPQSLLMEAPVPANAMGASSSTPGDGSVDIYDPVLISLIRRAAPNLVAFDLAGVQPMSGPTGLIFAMRSRYTNQTSAEAFYNESNTGFSTVRGSNNEIVGDANSNLGTTPSGNSEVYNYAGGMTTLQAEALGADSNVAFAEMAFSIEQISVTARSRALKAEYTMELAQDLKAIHGLDAERELATILSTEIVSEINREFVRLLVVGAVPGAVGTTVAGTFDLDVDSNGRWSVEKFKGLLFHIEQEANQLAKETRRGRGNLILCSSDVASALQMAGVLDYTPALNGNNGNVPDDTGNTFVGVLNGRYKVYIDPHAGANYCVVGYKGSNPFDAGFFYCPYVPLQMVRAVGENSFQPKIGFKTRYGMVANPFSRGATASDGSLVANSNVYYRRFLVSNIM